MASEKILAMIEEVKGLSVLELNELVKALEEEFGVSAAAVAVAGPAAGGAAAAEEKTEFDVVLASFGDAKMAGADDYFGSLCASSFADARHSAEHTRKRCGLYAYSLCRNDCGSRLQLDKLGASCARGFENSAVFSYCRKYTECRT